MNHKEHIREEILSWADETDQILLESFGRRLAEDKPLGFRPSGIIETSGYVRDAENWLDENTREIEEAYDNIEVLEQVELAVELSDVMSSTFIEMPLALLSLIVARRILGRRKAKIEAPEIGGVSKKGTHQVDKDKSERTGELTRKFFANALRRAMEADQLSWEEAAKKAGTSVRNIDNILSERASLDKGNEVLTNLGHPPTILIPSLEGD